MGKTWKTDRRGDEKDFLRWLRKDKVVYVVTTHNRPASARALYHPQTYSEHVCTGPHPILGGMQIGHNTLAKDFLRWHGEVHDTPPRGIPHHSNDGPRVAGPLPAGEEFDRPIDKQELKQMQYWEDEANDRRAAHQKRTRKWF